MTVAGLIDGRVVHYVAYNGRNLAAIVTGHDRETGVVDLVVFTNMQNAAGVKNGGMQFHFEVRMDQDGPPYKPGTWHWPVWQ